MPTAIVSGGAVRLGRAMALHLARSGWNIALHHNASASNAETAVREIRSLGVHCEPFAADFTRLAESERLIGQISKKFPDVELLINSAANFIQEDIEHTSLKTLETTLRINLMSPFLLMREYRKRVNRGMIVNILDERILRNVPAFAAYSVSKVGLAHLTHLAAIEWGPEIRVNAIAPGLILPPAGEGPEYLERNARLVPTLTHGKMEDILRGLDYLLESPFVNGETLFIDGGQSKGPARKKRGKLLPPQDPSWLDGEF